MKYRVCIPDSIWISQAKGKNRDDFCPSGRMTLNSLATSRLRRLKTV
jgi:hypothetical protein